VSGGADIGSRLVPTPEAWLVAAAAQWPEVLIDHAYCEKKAASSALALIFAYPECEAQALSLARLAREELRHFEQVIRMMARLGVKFRRLQPGRYAAGLRSLLRTHEPQRRVDLLLANALIEARSCERFGALAKRLPAPLGEFYADLERAEARHTHLYLELAHAAAMQEGMGAQGVDARLAQLLALEGPLITAVDEQLRFHSGPPAVERGSVSSSGPA